MKKLTLSKETVRCLQDHELRNVNGGVPALGGIRQHLESDGTCQTCFLTCGCPTDYTCDATECVCTSYGLYQACPW